MWLFTEIVNVVCPAGVGLSGRMEAPVLTLLMVATYPPGVRISTFAFCAPKFVKTTIGTSRIQTQRFIAIVKIVLRNMVTINFTVFQLVLPASIRLTMDKPAKI